MHATHLFNYKQLIMDLLKFEQLQIGNTYLLHCENKRRVILFTYWGGTLNGDCTLPYMIEFDNSIINAPTAYFPQRTASGKDFNASTNTLFSSYQEIPITSLLAVYYRVANSMTYKQLWEIGNYSDINPDRIQTFKFLP
jgi:hypothetical protein